MIIKPGDDTKPHLWRTHTSIWWHARSATIVGCMGLTAKDAYDQWAKEKARRAATKPAA